MSISALRSARCIFSVMAVTVFSALVLVGCAKDDDDTGGGGGDGSIDKALIGTWVLEENDARTIIFTDKTMTMHEIYEDDEGEVGEWEHTDFYTASGGKIKIVNPDGEDFEIKYSIKNGKLTLYMDGDEREPIVLVRKK